MRGPEWLPTQEMRNARFIELLSGVKYPGISLPYPAERLARRDEGEKTARGGDKKRALARNSAPFSFFSSLPVYGRREGVIGEKRDGRLVLTLEYDRSSV